MTIQLAQQLNASDAIPVLSQNLNEEREMADWLRANTPVILSKLFPAIESSLAQEEKPQTDTVA
jgi:ferritin-like metal-binding protein YciE